PRPIVAARILAILAVVAALWWAQTLLVPIVLSVLISYALEPAVAGLEARRLPRALAVPLLLIALAAGIGATIYLLRGGAVAVASRIPVAVRKVTRLLHAGRPDPVGPVAKIQQVMNELEQAAATNRRVPDTGDVTPVRVEEPTFKWRQWLWQGSYGALDVA